MIIHSLINWKEASRIFSCTFWKHGDFYSFSWCTPCNEWLCNPAPCGLILELVWCVHTLAMAEGQGSRAATLLAAPRQGLGNPRSALPVNAGVQWLALPGVWRAGSASTQGIFAPAWFTEVWWYLQGHPEDERADGTSHHCRGLCMESRAKGITWCHTSLVDRQHVHEWREECKRGSEVHSLKSPVKVRRDTG